MAYFKKLKIALSKKLKERFIAESSLVESYYEDESSEKGKIPFGVAFPQNTQEVSLITSLCYRYKVPYTVRGLGTGKTGGMLLTKAGIIISLEQMKSIQIDPINLLAIVEPGAITSHIQEKAQTHGLFYPVDPASLEMCSIGGNIAENAGGPRAFKYGVTRDFVLGLEVVLPKGEIVVLGGKTRKNVTGYSLKDIMIGSEGTLGTITKAYLKLLPYPNHRTLIWATFHDFEHALNGMTKAYSSGINPASIEFIEKRAFERVAQLTQQEIPYQDAHIHLLIELDGFDENAIKSQEKSLALILEKEKATNVLIIPYENKQEQIWDLRRKISEATKSFSVNKKSEDVVVPASSLKGFLEEIHQLEKEYAIEIICFGHLGDGNVHVNILNLSQELWLVWEKFHHKVIKKVFEITKKHGGTLSGEHGIGLSKKKYLPLFLDSKTLSLHKKIKKIFDPKNLLNPGKIW